MPQFPLEGPVAIVSTNQNQKKGLKTKPAWDSRIPSHCTRSFREWHGVFPAGMTPVIGPKPAPYRVFRVLHCYRPYGQLSCLHSSCYWEIRKPQSSPWLLYLCKKNIPAAECFLSQMQQEPVAEMATGRVAVLPYLTQRMCVWGNLCSLTDISAFEIKIRKGERPTTELEWRW